MKYHLKDLFDEFPIDRVITSDEWDHFRYLISGELEACEFEDHEFPLRLPFFLYFEDTIKDKLIGVGFKKEIIEDKKDFGSLIYIINFEQGRTFKNHSWDLDTPYGFPAGTYKVSEDSHTMWINSDIDAALRVLESIRIMKELLINNGVVNKDAVKVYLRTLELTINLTRAGNIPMLAIAESDKRKKSLTTRELKKEVMRAIIDSIFKENPHRPKTLGEVWNKIDRGHGGVRNRRTKEVYIAKTGKDANGNDIVIITGDVKKPMEYVKRSLQHFIDELKNKKPEVTQ